MTALNPLKWERELRGWSQERVAEAVGATSKTVGHWEKGLSLPYPHYREKLGTLFGKSPEELGLIPGHETKVTTSTSIQPPQSKHASISDPILPYMLATKSLHGRENLLKQLRERLCVGGRGVLTALNGLPGVGKTTLAVALATDAEVLAHYADGVLWAGLGPQANIASLLSRWGSLLGISTEDVGKDAHSKDWMLALRAAIGQRRMLLVIDDVWQMEAALSLRVGGPNCSYLLTTRFPQIAISQASSEAILVPELEEQDGLGLLAQYASEAVEQDRQVANELVQAVGGLPLALTLMGKYLRIQSHNRQPRRIREALSYLRKIESRLSLTVPVSPQDHTAFQVSLSLRSVIALSDERLSEQESQALRALAVFPARPASFSEEAALVVAQIPFEVLDGLSDAGLLESSSPGRYTLHQTIVDYAQAKQHDLAPSERFSEYFVRYVEENVSDNDALDQEERNISAALETALTLHHYHSASNGFRIFDQFLSLHRTYDQALYQLQRFKHIAAVRGDHYALTVFFFQMSVIHETRGDYTQAELYAQRCLQAGQQIGKTGIGLGALAWVTRARGNYEQAELYVQEGLSNARAHPDEDPDTLYHLLLTLSGIAREVGDYKLAEEAAHECLELCLRVDDQNRAALARILLGTALLFKGDFGQAEIYLQEALASSVRLKALDVVALAYGAAGPLALIKGDFELARTYAQEGLAVARYIDSKERIGHLLWLQGLIARLQGEIEQAEVYLHEAWDLLSQIDQLALRLYTLIELGELALQKGEVEQAATYFQQLQKQAPPICKDLLGSYLFGLARVAEAQGDLATARELGIKSLSAFAAIGHFQTMVVSIWLNGLSPSDL